jgi:hypothetical protein
VPTAGKHSENLCLFARAQRTRLRICAAEIMKRLGLGVIVALALTLPAFGQSVDPFIGTWKLNTAKSTSSGYPLNKSSTLNIVREGQTLVANADGVDAQGQPFKRVTQHIYDGQPHPTTGNPDWDATAFTRVGNTINAVRFKNGKVVEVAQYIIDPGKTYSGHSEGVTANGQPLHDYLVWDRQ